MPRTISERRRLAVLAEAGAAFSALLDERTILDRLAALAVQVLGDWCSVDVLVGDELERVVLAHADPARADVARILRRYPPTLGSTSPVAEAIKTRTVKVLSDIPKELIESSAHDELHRSLLQQLRVRHGFVVPLVVRGSAIGAMSVASVEPDAGFEDVDVEFAEELAGRATLAIDAARLLGRARRAELRYRSLVDSLDAIVWEADAPSGRVRFMGRGVEAILGYAPERFLAEEDMWHRVIHPDDRDWVGEHRRKAIDEGRDHELEYRAIAANNRTVWLHERVFVPNDNGGTPAFVRGLTIDVSDRKAEEQEKAAHLAVARVLAEADSLDDIPTEVLHRLVEALDWDVGVLWTTDEDGALTCGEFVSTKIGAFPSFEALTRMTVFREGLGLPGSAAEGRQAVWVEDVSVDPRFSRAPTAIEEGLRTGLAFPLFVGGNVIAVIELFSRHSRAREEGTIRLLTALGTQVGQFVDRRRVMRELQGSEERLRSILDSALDAVIGIDPHGVVLEFNPAAERLFGYRRVEAVGRELAPLVIPPDLREQHRVGLARVLATGRSQVVGRRLEMRAMRADGSEVPVEISVTELRAGRAPLFIAFVRDISERRAAQQRRDLHFEITRVLAEARSEREAAARIVQIVPETLGWAVGAFWLRSEENDTMVPLRTWVHPERATPEMRAFERRTKALIFPKGEGLIGDIWQQGEPTWLEDLGSLPRYRRADEAHLAGLRSVFVLPIVRRGQILGLLEFYNTSPMASDDELTRMMITVARQIGSFIERIRAITDLRLSRAILASQSHASTEGILVLSPDSKILSRNDRFDEMFGIDPGGASDLDDQAILEAALASLADPTIVAQRVADLINDHETTEDMELTLRDGRAYEVHTTPLPAAEPELPLGRAWYFRDVSERRRSERILREASEQAAFMSEVGAVLVGSTNVTEMLNAIAALVVPALGDWCVIDLVQRDGSVVRSVVQYRDTDARDIIGEMARRGHHRVDPAAETGIPKVLRTGKTEWRAEVDPSAFERVAPGDPTYARFLDRVGVRSYICVPMVARGRVLGAITLLATSADRRFDRSAVRIAEDLAWRVALAVDSALLYKDRAYVAETLQRSLLPPMLPGIPGLEVAARYLPAGEGGEVAGDFYDIFEAGRNDWAIVVGDVCGKGAASAALTALARHTIRAAAVQAKKPKRVLLQLNDAMIRHDADDDRFATVAYARLRRGASPEWRLTLALAGHPLPFLIKRGAEAEGVGRPGMLLGTFPDVELFDQALPLGPGDMIVLFTDGVTEARNEAGEMFGEDGIQTVLNSLHEPTAEEAVDTIEQAALDHQGGVAQDDMAIVSVRVEAKEEEPA